MTIKEISQADIVRLQGKVIDDYVWKFYFNDECHLCSLCGNSGVIDTRATAISGAGITAGRLNYCICPNGREMREDKDKLMDATERMEYMKQHLKDMKAKYGEQ